MIPLHWRLIAALAVAAAIWGHGNVSGKAACRAEQQEDQIRVQKELFRVADEASREELKRLEAERERDAMSQQLEDLAYAEPPSDGCGLPASRVLRLNDR